MIITKLQDLQDSYELRLKTNLAEKLRSISSGQRLYLFDFTSIYTYRKYWNGDSSYKTRSYGIDEKSDFQKLLGTELFVKVTEVSSLSEIASKSELKNKAESQGLEIKKSWTLKKIVENLSKSEEGNIFLKVYLSQENVVGFKDEYKDDLQAIFEYQKRIKTIVDLVIMH